MQIINRIEQWYLYALTNNDVVFYIGISRFPQERFKQHCGSGDICTSNYVYWMKYNNIMPSILLVDTFNNQRIAELAERSLIRYHALIKHKLCNEEFNPIRNRFINCIPEKRERLKRFKDGYSSILIKEAKNKMDKLEYSKFYKEFYAPQYREYTMDKSAKVS
jgi:predicted GIY-YIG superfamily endonuclease